MATTISNVVQGAAKVYWGAVGATEPTDATTTPAIAWTELGGTKDGVTITITQEYSELEVDQVLDIAGSQIVKREITLETNLAESTLENLKVLLNGGVITSTAGKKTYEPAAVAQGAPTYIALLIDAVAPGGLKRRFIARRALSVGDLEISYTKDEQTVFPAEFKLHFVSDAIKPFIVIDEVAV